MRARSFFRGLGFTTSKLTWAPPALKSGPEAITISYTIPRTDKDSEIVKETYASSKSFTSSFPGFRFTHPKSGLTYSPAELLELVDHTIDPDVVYIAEHHFLSTKREEIIHSQLDKAFEERACKTLEDYLQDHFYASRRVSEDDRRPNAWRTLTKDDGRVFAEWEGIWEGPDGDFYFLEAKYYMNFVSNFKFSFVT